MEVARPAADRAATQDELAELRPEIEVVRPIGRGSTSDVFLAREPALKRLVAVKVMRADVAMDALKRKRFEREAQSAARITHAHVTSIYRVGRLEDGRPFIVMEYVDGRTVRDIVEARGALEPGEARALLEAVADALAAAHQRGIVHRDVTPDNIFVESGTGRAVLSDFGIAALLETGSDPVTRLTGAGVRLGQVRYASPELLRGEPVTQQSDVYSFGMLAYEVLTGRGPYDAATDAQYMAAHLTMTPRPIRSLRPDLDAPWLSLLEKCLGKEAKRRPSAAELTAALRNATSRADTAPHDRTPLGQFFDELKRRRVYQVMVGYGAFAVAVLGIAQVVFDAFDLTDRTYRIVVLITLAGFPAAMVLSWLYDVSGSGIVRTRSTDASRDTRPIKWIAFALSVLAVTFIGWLLLRGR